MNIDLNYTKIALQLSYLNVIKISGRDAISFLNDQFTNDISTLQLNQWQFNGYCSSKGRLIAVMRLFVSDDCVYIILPASMSELMIKRLQVFVFRAKVNFDVLADHSLYCLMNAQAIKNTGEMQAQEVKPDDGGFLVNVSIQSDRYMAILKSSDALTDLAKLSHEESMQLWRLAEIRDMVPNIDVQTSGLFIPQHVNLDKLNGISFSKGCFPGQEVVARLHYLGKAKQAMKHIVIDSNTPIAPGQTFNHPDFKSALKIVDAVQTQDQTFECLAVGQFN